MWTYSWLGVDVSWVAFRVLVCNCHDSSLLMRWCRWLCCQGNPPRTRVGGRNQRSNILPSALHEVNFTQDAISQGLLTRHFVSRSTDKPVRQQALCCVLPLSFGDCPSSLPKWSASGCQLLLHCWWLVTCHSSDAGVSLLHKILQCFSCNFH